MFKITPHISAADSVRLSEGLTAPQALVYNPVDHDFSLVDASTSGSSFINALLVYVDPNGDNATGVFGDKDKPFQTPFGALYCAAQFMDTYSIIIPTGMSDSNAVIRDSGVPFITINVAPGIYDVSEDISYIFETFELEVTDVNLMYNFINWDLQPGAIMYGYELADNAQFLAPGARIFPIVCNVYGDGIWITTESQWLRNIVPIRLYYEGSNLSFKCHSSHLRFYTASESTLNYEVDLQICIQNTTKGKDFNVHGRMDGGNVNVKIRDVRYRVFELSEFRGYYTFFDQTGGTLNMQIENYCGHYLTNGTEVTENTFVISDYWGGTYYKDYMRDNYDLTTQSWGGPSLGDWYCTDEKNPTIANIKLGKAVFSNDDSMYIAIFSNSLVNFHPGDCKVLINATFRGNVVYGIITGGPDIPGIVSKTSVYGGKIILTSTVPDNAVGFLVQNESQLYIQGTQILMDDNIPSQFGVAYTPDDVPSGYQTPAIILDGVKFTSGLIGPGIMGASATSLDTKYTLYLDTSALTVPTTVFDVKIYGNCFSNLNPIGATASSSPATINYQIPGTALIIDDNVQIL